ncbi:MAG: hypothetical protein CVU40_04205 [Chloroflexi bacterium HGW-Chloroflexi-2]|jgi:hypothetical protein|nr:MAG: hypothetical protein CVU40_04205 [Chloroflexi bacterium HGW-Chloroflexi-2]
MKNLKKILFLAIIFIFISIFASFNVSAQEEIEEPERIKLVENTFTQYTWRLVTRTGVPVCIVVINHEGFPTGQETLAACNESWLALFPTPTVVVTGTPTPQPTSTPIVINQLWEDTYWVFVSSEEVTLVTQITIPDIIVNIYAPGIPVSAPYVVIKAIEPYSEYKITRIAGTVNEDPFECFSDQCIVPLIQDAQIRFWAESSFGDQTKVITTIVRIFISNDYYNVRITSIDQLLGFTDSCREIWRETAYGESPDWVVFPESPDMLATFDKLHYLAGKLILNRFVDASSCPNGGLFANGAPNACGLEIVEEAMFAWQNRFDPIIWATGRESGISPVLIKSIIEQESQFWPENARYLYEEYGFTQINELGADVALRWNEDLKNQICSGLLFNCDESFVKMNAFEQAMLRGGLIRSIDAYCPACENMINLDIAEQSIAITGQVIKSNCSQANYIVSGLELKATLTDMWKFTILSYHGGYYCLRNSLEIVKEKGLEPTWANVSANLVCPNARDYVDSVWENLTSFQLYYAPQPTLSPEQLQPTGQSDLVQFPPTVTPTLTPTPKTYLASGKINVYLYIDTNMDFVMDEDELIENANILVEFANGSSKTVPVQNGEAIIEYENQFKNSDVTITVLEIYQSTQVRIPESGELFTILRIPPPELPGLLP